MIADSLRAAAKALATVSDAPRQEAEWLMAHCLGATRQAMLLSGMREAEPSTFAPLLARRLTGEPLAYVIGHQPFHGLELIVTPDVLIPRADSEVAIAAAREAAKNPVRILDCGTGSGALLLAALSVWSDATGIGIDSSRAALSVARDNAKSNGLSDRASFEPRDWTQDGWREGLGRFDLILANPPYVAIDDPDLDPRVATHEPTAALFAGADGLDDYRALIPALPELMTPNAIACVEIGARQGPAVSRIAQAAGMAAETIPDLAGNPRVVRLYGAMRG